MRILSSIILSTLLMTSLLEARHVILCGGPALRQWENLREGRDQHDRWWANFIRASTLRMDEIRKIYGPEAPIIWIIYKTGYTKRGYEDNKPYITWIREQAQKRNATIKWITTGSGAINAINKQPHRSIKTFDFFGHSNRYCLMLDYGCNIMAASKAWIHENDCSKIKSSVFSPNALCQSYGCHTGESMSARWKTLIGIPLTGAVGKTDYIPVGKGLMPKTMGHWTQ